MPYAYLVTLHIPAGAPSVLDRIVDRQLAEKARPGPLNRRYTGLADETERALKVLSDRLCAGGAARGGSDG
ncbi:hypothetical protein A5674_15770 [Mycobacterium malmoense]|uniref:hypothetical protein n=1 Tax=Mycobacterium malmoense TaxID=1780 RepID=UPI00080B4660|nr:hypothetical protein A5674_15770 [Mycobacterium malmoense]